MVARAGNGENNKQRQMDRRHDTVKGKPKVKKEYEQEDNEGEYMPKLPRYRVHVWWSEIWSRNSYDDVLVVLYDSRCERRVRYV